MEQEETSSEQRRSDACSARLAKASASSLPPTPKCPLHHATVTLGFWSRRRSSVCQRAASGIVRRRARAFGSIRFQPLLRHIILHA
jgi:hypothetical protein